MKFSLRPLFDELAEIRLVASSLAFYSLLSIIPFLLMVLSAFQYIGGLEQFYPKVEVILYSSLKEAIGGSVTRFIRNTLDQVDFKAIGISGAIFLVWASIGLLRNIDIAINRIWKIKIKTPFYKRVLLYWGILIGVPVGFALFIGTRSLVLMNEGIKSPQHQFLFSVWICLFLFLMYKLIPAVQVRWVPAIVSAIAAGAGLWCVQKSFLWVSFKVFRQNKIYGSLASVPIFLLWLLVIWYVILLGASLCAFLQQRGPKTP